MRTGKVLQGHRVRYGYGRPLLQPRWAGAGRTRMLRPGLLHEVWDAQTGERLFSRHVSRHASAIAFSSDAQLAGVGTEDGKVLSGGSRDGEQLGSPIQVAPGSVGQISFSPNGRLFATSSSRPERDPLGSRTRKRLGNTFPIEGRRARSRSFEASGDLAVMVYSRAGRSGRPISDRGEASPAR